MWIVGNTLSGKLEGVFCLESERQYLKRILKEELAARMRLKQWLNISTPKLKV